MSLIISHVTSRTIPASHAIENRYIVMELNFLGHLVLIIVYMHIWVLFVMVFSNS